MTVVEQSLEEKVELHHGPRSSVLNGHKAELQAQEVHLTASVGFSPVKNTGEW